MRTSASTLGLVVAVVTACDSSAMLADAGRSPRDGSPGELDGSSGLDASPDRDDAGSMPRDAAPRRDVMLPDHPTRPELIALPANTWTILADGGPRLEGRLAYSGGAYDRLRHRFYVFGGGHADGWHNDVLSFDIASATWTVLGTTDSAEDHVCSNTSTSTPGMLLSSSRPASRHTYDQIDFLEATGEMIVWSGPTYSTLWTCEGQTIPRDTWLFDPDGPSWTYVDVASTESPACEAGYGGYDPTSGLYFAIDRDGYYQSRLWSFDRGTERWTLRTPAGEAPAFDILVLTVDRARSRLIAYPFVYDIAAAAWSRLPATGPAPADDMHRAQSYDEASDVLVVPEDDGRVHVYDLATDTWESLTATGDLPTIESQTYNRFFYDPIDGVHLLIQGNPYEPRVYAYRYR